MDQTFTVKLNIFPQHSPVISPTAHLHSVFSAVPAQFMAKSLRKDRSKTLKEGTMEGMKEERNSRSFSFSSLELMGF